MGSVFEIEWKKSRGITAAVVMGRSANGLLEWKTEDHVALKYFNESMISDN